jgi:hypothetical protein
MLPRRRWGERPAEAEVLLNLRHLRWGGLCAEAEIFLKRWLRPEIALSFWRERSSEPKITFTLRLRQWGERPAEAEVVLMLCYPRGLTHAKAALWRWRVYLLHVELLLRL